MENDEESAFSFRSTDQALRDSDQGLCVKAEAISRSRSAMLQDYYCLHPGPQS